MRLELIRIAADTAAVAGAPGRVSPAPDRVHGPTILHAFEIPPLDDALLHAPRILVAAAGGAGWRQAALLLSLDEGGRWNAAGAATIPAIMGDVVTPPAGAGSTLLDLASVLEVELSHAVMELTDADDAALDQGANVALVGDELLQFGRAARVGPRRWRLTRLWRGRRGTEWAIGTQAVGDRFILLEADALIPLDVPLSALGTDVKLLASGVGDLAGPAAAVVKVDGASIAPPSPVDLRWIATDDGGAVLRWTRRSRAGWQWADDGDVPLGEEREAYRIELPGRTVTLAAPELIIAAAERAAGPLTVTVRQLGTYAASRPALIVIPGS